MPGDLVVSQHSFDSSSTIPRMTRGVGRTAPEVNDDYGKRRRHDDNATSRTRRAVNCRCGGGKRGHSRGGSTGHQRDAVGQGHSAGLPLRVRVHSATCISHGTKWNCCATRTPTRGAAVSARRISGVRICVIRVASCPVVGAVH